MANDQLIGLGDWPEIDNLAQKFVLRFFWVMLAKNGIGGGGRPADPIGAMNEKSILLRQLPRKGQDLLHQLAAGRKGGIALEAFLLINVITYCEVLAVR